jgi:hypothetical protein
MVSGLLESNIIWQYFKDRSITRGEDKGFLRSINITGTTYAQTSCTNCPIGHFSNLTAASSCLPCPAGTYNPDTIGASNCSPCPLGTFSFEGATRCIPNNPCSIAMNSSDISYYYTPCFNGTRLKRFALINPPACDDTGIVLPPDNPESCVPAPCLPGQYRDPTNVDRCLYCQPGTYSVRGETTLCQSCLLGQSSNQRVQHINTWGPNWETGIDTGCEGDTCTGSGWRKAYWYTDSGLGLVDGSRSWLQLTTMLSKGSEIFMRYSLPCNVDSNFIFSLNGTVMQSFNCEGGCSAPLRNFSFVLPDFLPSNTCKFL